MYSAQSAANQLCKVLGIEQAAAKNKNDPEQIRKWLEDRIEFGLEGYRRGGIKLKRRDMLEMFAKIPGSLMPGMIELIRAELASEAIQ